MEFENLGLSPDLVKALVEVGWMYFAFILAFHQTLSNRCPTDIQQEVIPLMLTGSDVVGVYLALFSCYCSFLSLTLILIVYSLLKQVAERQEYFLCRKEK